MARGLQFTGVLLAGGRSQRMGRDKALLTLAGGDPLWQWQLEKLHSLGLAEVVVSGPSRPGFPPGLRCLADAYPGHGPLGGLGTVFDACPQRPVLVLAVDVPRISAGFLNALLTGSSFEVGRVPKVAGHYEPLVAVYPPSARSFARRALTSGCLRLQDFAQSLVNAGSVLPYDVPRSEWADFVNWNRPEDLPPDAP
ncbi:MAG TPA: molybdenum cofactor guanylyltransferase [Chthoniobacterales bacterium]